MYLLNRFALVAAALTTVASVQRAAASTYPFIIPHTNGIEETITCEPISPNTRAGLRNYGSFATTQDGSKTHFEHTSHTFTETHGSQRRVATFRNGAIHEEICLGNICQLTRPTFTPGDAKRIDASVAGECRKAFMENHTFGD